VELNGQGLPDRDGRVLLDRYRRLEIVDGEVLRKGNRRKAKKKAETKRRYDCAELGPQCRPL
jgi:hypothetical protein